MNAYPIEDRVLTDYSIHVERVLAGSLPARQTQTPGTIVAPLVLTALGGDVTVNGVLIRQWHQIHEGLEGGRRYLLFLMKARRGEPGRFEIYNGGVFEVSQERARPLIRDAKRVFIDVTDATIAELISRIQKAAPNR